MRDDGTLQKESSNRNTRSTVTGKSDGNWSSKCINKTVLEREDTKKKEISLKECLQLMSYKGQRGRKKQKKWLWCDAEYSKI